MHLNRKVERTVKFILDECIPPILRDNRTLMRFLFGLVFRDKGEYFLNFKDQAFFMSESEIKKVYQGTSQVHIQHSDTDLSKKSIHTIMKNVLGDKVLDVGCGKGVLAKILSKRHKVTACDIVLDKKVVQNNSQIQFKEVNIKKLPFSDGEFDTVTCTHTLEHVQNLLIAIKELRRVARKRLIIIVPKERPYKYTFNLHLHFFPNKYCLYSYLQQSKEVVNQNLMKINGAWYYQEDLKD